MQFLLMAIISYLAGSVPFGKIIAQKHGIDIQKKGSGNIGFTNILRTLGLKLAIFVLIGDVLKGFIPVFISEQFLPLNQVLIIAFIAIFGHIFSVWLKFKGGKGIATGLGAIFVINPLITLIGLIIFITVFLITKIISISSIISVYALPVIAYFIFPKLAIFYLIIALIATYTHRDNLDRLLKGTEKRITN